MTSSCLSLSLSLPPSLSLSSLSTCRCIARGGSSVMWQSGSREGCPKGSLAVSLPRGQGEGPAQGAASIFPRLTRLHTHAGQHTCCLSFISTTCLCLHARISTARRCLIPCCLACMCVCVHVCMCIGADHYATIPACLSGCPPSLPLHHSCNKNATPSTRCNTQCNSNKNPSTRSRSARPSPPAPAASPTRALPCHTQALKTKPRPQGRASASRSPRITYILSIEPQHLLIPPPLLPLSLIVFIAVGLLLPLLLLLWCTMPQESHGAMPTRAASGDTCSRPGTCTHPANTTLASRTTTGHRPLASMLLLSCSLLQTPVWITTS
jgi:hypothetical protein